MLASGAAIPISQLKAGAKVLATSTTTGKTQAETIAAVLVHHDTDLYDLKIRDHGTTAVIGTTTNHLFWVPATGHQPARWMKAGALKYGTHLRTHSGSDTAVVTGGWIPPQSSGWMWDLSVPGNNDHDFYVDTVAAPVLVHNCNVRGLWQLTREGSSAVKQGGPFRTTFYKSASDGTWWTRDVAGHGESAFKVYEETSRGLSWITNANEYGDYIEGMWKGPVGRFIPWSQLHG